MEPIKGADNDGKWMKRAFEDVRNQIDHLNAAEQVVRMLRNRVRDMAGMQSIPDFVL